MTIQVNRKTEFVFRVNGEPLHMWCYKQNASDFMDNYLQKVLEEIDRWDSMAECIQEEIDQRQNHLETTEAYDEDTGEYLDASAYQTMEQIKLLKALLKEAK